MIIKQIGMTALLVASWPAVVSLAQEYAIERAAISGGGGKTSGGQFTVIATIGQPEAGKLTGGTYSVTGGFWSIIAAVHTPGAPVLAIRSAGRHVEIAWPAVNSGFVLEVSSTLGATAEWKQVEADSTLNGNQFVVTVPVEPGHRFYRLRKR